LLSTLSEEQIEIYFRKSFAAHSYVVAAAKIEHELQRLSLEAAESKERLCPRVGTYQCPLNYYPKQKELAKLQKAYAKLIHAAGIKIYGRHMYRKIRKWEKVLRKPSCPMYEKQNDLCQTLSALWKKMVEQIADYKNQLAALPDYRTFNDEFLKKKSHLEHMGYIEEGRILPRGEIARQIYVQELLVTELIFSGILEQLDDDQLNALISCVDYESKRNDYFNKLEQMDFSAVKEIAAYVQSVCGAESVRFDHRPAVITYFWSKGLVLRDIQQLCTLDEGDIIAVFRRTIDLLRQMREAVDDQLFKERLSACMKKLDRDEASILELY
jgi:superfamily II RNA helicase